jgi:hypothetical protein
MIPEMLAPNCDIFWVGSYPHKNALSACRRILKTPNLLLHWPQLPKRSVKERWTEQTFSVLNAKNRDSFLKGYASGWTTMWRLLKLKRNSPQKYFKSQIAGPITLFGKKKDNAHQKKLMEYTSLWLAHAYWQIDEIKKAGYKPLLVLDEPLLPSSMGPLGSASAKKTLQFLRSMVSRLRRRGALIGIHCCNRVSPELLINSGADLIHFDAFDFPTQVTASRKKIQDFLLDGGLIAWGIIPIEGELDEHEKIKMEKSLIGLLSQIETRGLSLRKILAQSFIAPTCGTSSLSPSESDEILAFAVELSRQLKKNYKL